METNKLDGKELIIEPYSEKSFVVRGNTKEYKHELMALKGKFNPYLNGGPGYIFSNAHLKNVENFISKLDKTVQYQQITYRFPLLLVGMGVELNNKNSIINATIIKVIKNQSGIVETAIAHSESENKDYTLKIINGEWGVVDNNITVTVL